MSNEPPGDGAEPQVRKSVSIDASDWERVQDFRFGRRFNSEAAAIRAVLRAGLDALGVPRKTGKADP